MLTKLKLFSGSSGQSIIEIIVALAIFITIASGSIIAIIGSLSTTRLAEEETTAALFAQQGIEATQSIRNQDWDNLTNGDHGVDAGGGSWSFSGTSDDPDGTGKYTRVVNVADVQRDGNEDIVSSGGTVDDETKLITSTVTWNFTPGRNNEVQSTTYLTNWQMSKGNGGTTATPTPTPSPSPGVNTCTAYCVTQGYSGGTCRANVQQCTNNSETNEALGDVFCTGGNNADTCCCAP